MKRVTLPLVGMVALLVVTGFGCGGGCSCSCRQGPPPRVGQPLLPPALVDNTDMLVYDTVTRVTTYSDPAGLFTLHIPGSVSLEWCRLETGLDEAAALVHPQAKALTRVLYRPEAEDAATEPFLTIFGFTPDEWAAMRRQPGPSLGVQVGESAGLALVAAIAKDNPYPADSEDYKRFEVARGAAPRMIASLRESIAPIDDAVPQSLPAAGIYSTTLPAADASGRTLTLNLRGTGRAELTHEYKDKGEAITETGRWTRAGEVIALVLFEEDGKTPASEMSWTIDDGNLTPRTWDKTLYGETGLYFSRSATP